MILFSSPSYTTMPRNGGSLFATDPCSYGVHSALASAISSDAFSFKLLRSMNWRNNWFTTVLSFYLLEAWCIDNKQVSCCSWPVAPFEMSDEKWYIIRSFHSSVLSEYSPSVERFIFPLAVLNPKDTSKRGPPYRVRWAESGGRHNASWNDLPLDVWSLFQMGLVHFKTKDIACLPLQTPTGTTNLIIKHHFLSLKPWQMKSCDARHMQDDNFGYHPDLRAG